MERDEVLLHAFASELKSRRGKLSLSQDELAYRAEVNRTYIAKLELAKHQPTLFVVLKLAEALQADLPDLLRATLDRYQAALARIEKQLNIA